MRIRYFALVLLTAIAFAQEARDPWTPDQAITPADFAKALQSDHAPVIFMVGPRILFNGDHIRGANFAGPAGTDAGLALLKQQASKIPSDADIVLYCGCCPMDHCPNIRPAFRALHDAGFSHVTIVSIPTNLHTDWTEKGYPVEKGSVPK